MLATVLATFVTFGCALHGYFLYQKWIEIVEEGAQGEILGWFEEREWPVMVYGVSAYVVTVVGLMYVLKPRTKVGANGRSVPFASLPVAQAAYNAYQVCANLLMVWSVLVGVFGTLDGEWSRLFLVGGNRHDATNWYRRVLAFGLYTHYNNKYVEFFDTFFMLVKGSWRQVSFLHVFHHTIMAPAWYFAIVDERGGQLFWGAFLNSTVHVVMYYYYLMSGLRSAGYATLPTPPKNLVTEIQLAQFALAGVHALYHYSVIGLRLQPETSAGCGEEVMGVVTFRLETALAVLMIALFGDFYVKAYLKANKNDKEK